MIRTQIQLSKDQARSIKRMAAAQSISMAEVIRRAIDNLIRTERRPSLDDVRNRALNAVGRFNVDTNDLSMNHDRHLIEAFED